MEELKEQTAREIPTNCIPCRIINNGCPDRATPCQFQLSIAERIFTLFQNWLKKELDGLEVKSDDELIDAYEKNNPADDHAIGITSVAQAQLDDVKNHFEKEDKK